ncbi:MAG: hypothetical protein LRS43_04135, partial [Desulfurococcales archaeon]|nr:hypothetical protein [Desulfurococcales archaeon]
GLPRAIVHELGHSLGEPHPFSYYIYGAQEEGARWLMDWASTVMSYDDSIIAGFLEDASGTYLYDYYTVFREGLRYTGTLALYMLERGVISGEEAKSLMEEALWDPIGAAHRAMAVYYSSEEGYPGTTITETATVTVTYTTTYTTVSTRTLTVEETETSTTTRFTTVTERVTVRETSTRTVTLATTLVETSYYTIYSTVTATTGQAGYTGGLPVTILILGLALLAGVAVALLLRGKR